MTSPPLPRPVLWLGLAGLLPICLCLAVARLPSVFGILPSFLAVLYGASYSAVILSFLGGLWWMAALQANIRSAPVYLVSVTPSLLAWSLYPMVRDPQFVIGAALLLSPLVDRWLARQIRFPDGWLRLRLVLGVGLGLGTILLEWPHHTA